MAHAGQLRCGTLRPQVRLLETAGRGIAMRPFTNTPPAVRSFTAHHAGVRRLARHCPVETQARLRIPLEDLEAESDGDEDEDGDEDDEEEEEDLEGPLRLERGFENKIVQVRRVTKVVKGGKQLKFRVTIVLGNSAGTVGTASASAREISEAVKKATRKAQRQLVNVTLTKKTGSLPHPCETKHCGARVRLLPAAEGTGLIAGGAVRTVLELAGVRNAFGKQVGCNNALNNAKAAVAGLASMRDVHQIAELRGVSVDKVLGREPLREAGSSTEAAAREGSSTEAAAREGSSTEAAGNKLSSAKKPSSDQNAGAQS